MTVPVSLIFAVLGLVTSSRIRVGFTVFGLPCGTSLLGLIFAAVIGLLAVLLVFLIRCIVQESRHLRPRTVTS